MSISNIMPDWFLESNRWKHFVGGFVLGVMLTVLSALGCAGGMEFKDRQWGGSWDWCDFWCTVAGGMLGQVVQVVLVRWIFF